MAEGGVDSGGCEWVGHDFVVANPLGSPTKILWQCRYCPEQIAADNVVEYQRERKEGRGSLNG